LYMSQVCNTQCCAVDCVMGAWSGWSSCSASCGPGNRTQSRSVLVAASCGGSSCGALFEVESCNMRPCPVNCSMSAWSAWSACNATCGGGFQMQSRSIVVQPESGGRDCPSLYNYSRCNMHACDVDCVVSEFEAPSLCSVPCGGGYQLSTRSILQERVANGKPCLNLTATTPCNTQACPIHCNLSSWSPWSQCSVPCGGGSQFQNRTILVLPRDGGSECSALFQTQVCNAQQCPVNCAVSDVQSPCSASCGGGNISFIRTILQLDAYGGRPCPALGASVPCNTQSCPINCKVSDWSDWFDCTAQCGRGLQ